ncbi:reverse transcriptase domain-containing protein [Tanacetum coccineum]
MADQRTMAELLRAPTEGYAEAIAVPPILAQHFELKRSLINMMTSDQFFRLEKDNPHDHIRWFNKITSTIKYKDVPNSAIKLYAFSFSLRGSAVIGSKRTLLVVIILERRTQDVCSTIIQNKSKVLNSRNKLIVSQVKSSDGNSSSFDIPKLTHAVNQQTSTVDYAYDGSLPSNSVAKPDRDDECERGDFTGPGTLWFTIKVPPPLVQKAKPPSQRNYVVHQRDPRHPHIPYPSRMNQEKRQEKDEVQIHKFWQMFKQLHINISLADALILIPKYQKMLKSLLFNKEKLLELANTPLNENCSAVILKKLPEKLGDPRKFLIPCGFSLPELISTQMTLELANREICTLVGIARDVFVPVGKFTFPTNFVIVDYESDPRVPLILGRPFLLTAHALIDVHGEEIILCDGNERLTLNMRHDTLSYSTQPHQESINMIDVYNVSHEEILEDLFATNHRSGNPTSSLTSHTDLTSPEVNDDVFDPEGDIIENFLNLDKTKDHPPYHDNPISGIPTPILKTMTKSSTFPTITSIEESDLIWEEFKAYLVSNSFPPGNSNPSSPLPPFHNSLSGSTTSSSPSLLISETSDYSLEEFADDSLLLHFHREMMTSPFI